MTSSTDGSPPVDRRQDPPPTAAEQLDGAPPPADPAADEAERQLRATVRSVSRLEESS